MLQIEDRITLERRISKTEESLVSLRDDIVDIKKSLKWMIGLMFTLNVTIISLLAKGISLL